MIRIAFRPTDIAMMERLASRGPQIIARLIEKMDSLMLRLQGHIVNDKLQGQVLHHRSGKLSASINAIPTRRDGMVLIAAVEGAAPPASYGWVHEQGGTHWFDIYPTPPRRALSFIGRDGSQVFARHVHHPPLPARPFMKPSLDEMEAQIVQEITDVLYGG